MFNTFNKNGYLTMLELGFICMGLGLGIVVYRVGIIALNDITKVERNKQ